MANKFKHPVYLSEEQICNYLEPELTNYFWCPNSERHREFAIGHCRLDFVQFSRHRVCIFEVKISADLDTVRQVCFYKRVVEQYLLETAPVRIKCNSIPDPDVRMIILAKNIDVGIRDICSLLEIDVYKIDFCKNSKIKSLTLQFQEDHDWFEVPRDHKFEDILIEKYGER